MKNQVEVSFVVNDSKIQDRVDGSTTLLNYLRDSLRLTGAKKGCGQAQCGTCTILLNDRPVKSCSLRLDSDKLKNARIDTIEGLCVDSGDLHPIQKAFIQAGALQCGFCTPGVIMSAKGLLMKNPAPGRRDIRKYLAPRNLCRCTGYQKIVDAVQEAGRVMSGKPARLEGVPDDAPLRQQEAAAKVTGRLQYADDLVWKNMLYGKVLFSAEPHARLIGLDTTAAKKMPGVAGVITADDIPGADKIGMIVRDQPALVATGGIIRSVADPIAAVFADSPAGAEQALKTIAVDYEPLPGVFNETQSAAKGAPNVHPDKPGNQFFHGCLERGDVQQAIDRAELDVSADFSTSRIAHGYLEPESGLAKPDGSGGVEIYYPTQTVFDDRAQVADVLDLPPEKVRVLQLPTGGAFGGKEDVIFHHILALAALKFDRPVKITLTREESLKVSQKKHGMRFKARLALDRDGTFKALDVEEKCEIRR